MVLGVEEINGQANPAGEEYNRGCDDLAHEGDGFLEDVKYGQNGKDDADNVNETCHGLDV